MNDNERFKNIESRRAKKAQERANDTPLLAQNTPKNTQNIPEIATFSPEIAQKTPILTPKNPRKTITFNLSGGVFNFILTTICTVILVIAIFTATGWLRGEKGARGQVADSTNIYANLTLQEIWDNNVGRVRDLYVDIEEFYQNYATDFLRGDAGTAGSITSAAVGNDVVRCAVDIVARRTGATTAGGNFSNGGAGVFYKFNFTPDRTSIASAYVITNYHVAARLVYDDFLLANEYYLTLWGRRDVRITAAFVGGSVDYDVAVLEIRGEARTVLDGNVLGATNGDYLFDSLSRNVIRPVTMAQTRNLVTGTPVAAVGNPLGQGMQACFGYINFPSKTISVERLDSSIGNVLNRMIVISAPINPGNSGGGLFNYYGELVGIVDARLNWQNSSSSYLSNSHIQNIAYAIPLDVVERVADQVIWRFINEPSSRNASHLNPISAIRADCGFTYAATSKTTAYINGEMVESEVVAIKIAGVTSTLYRIILIDRNGFAVTYVITNAYMVDEILIEAYYKTMRVVTSNGAVVFY